MRRPDPTAPIGVFDSGVGGLTVLSALRARLPGEDFVYLGDTARVPYGRKPPEMVRAFAREIGAFLVAEGVKGIVVACNTASSAALGDLERLPVPVWGVIEPGVAAARAHGGTIGVLGTRATISSGAYQTRLGAAGLSVWARACPLLAPLVEEGLADSPEARLLARHYLADRPPLSALILGCTHYPLLEPAIREAVGPGVALVDSAAATAAVVETDLAAARLLCSRLEGGRVVHWVTGDPASYRHTSGTVGGVEGELRRLELSRLALAVSHAS